MNAARTGYDALEALTDGTITAEERAWLDARAAESPEWAAAIKAHAPPTDAATDKFVEGILKVLDEGKVVTMRTRQSRWMRPVALAVGALAAGLLMFTMIAPKETRNLPAYGVSREGAASCVASQMRAGEPVATGDCGLFVLRPETSSSGDVAVQAYDRESGAMLKIERTEKQDHGVLHVYLAADDAAKNVVFAIGEPASMPRNFDEAKSNGSLID